MEAAVTSAIDDSGATQVFGRPPPPPRSEVDGPITFEYGRCSGCWTAGDTVCGSGIDGGCPTVAQLPRRYGTGGEAEHLQPLSATALGNLKMATEEEEKKRAAGRAAADVREKKKAAAAAQPVKAASEAKAPPKGFYMPKRGGLGIRIVGKDGKTAVVLRSQSLAPSAQPKVVAKQGVAPIPASVPKMTIKPAAKAAPTVSRPASSVHRRVRIIGMKGEEAFVELPAFKADTEAISYAYVPAGTKSEKTIKQTDPPASKGKGSSREDQDKQDHKAAKAARELLAQREHQQREGKDRKAANAAAELRAQRQKQEREERERKERQAKALADVAMSGGLGGFRKSSPATGTASMHTRKSVSSRSPTIVNGKFADASKAPSKASRRTMTPPPARVVSVMAASQVSSPRAKTASGAGWQSAGSNKVSGQTATSQVGWPGAAGCATSGASAPRAASARPASQTSHQSSKAPSQQGWQAMGSGITRPAQATANDSWRGESAVYKPPSPVPQPAPSQAPLSFTQQRRKASTPPSRPISITSSQISRKIAGIHNWNNATPSLHSRVPSNQAHPNSPRAPVLASIDTRRANNASQDTIFAGTGWISPHPLSVAPTDFEPPPQDQISIQGATMTYQEWRRLQEQSSDHDGAGGRNFSRTSSCGRTMQAGPWGMGNAPASLGGGVADSESGDGWSPNYHVPTVVSEHSQRSRQSVSQVSRFRSVGSIRQQSAASGSGLGSGAGTQRSFDDSLSGVGQWDYPPQIDGAGSHLRGSARDGAASAFGRTWYEPGRIESPAVFRSLNDDGVADRGEGNGTVQLRIPWDREAVIDSGRGR